MSQLDRERMQKIERELESAELELERAHRLLDTWGVPREVRDEETGDVTELSLSGRLESLPEDPGRE